MALLIFKRNKDILSLGGIVHTNILVISWHYIRFSLVCSIFDLKCRLPWHLIVTKIYQLWFHFCGDCGESDIL